MKKQLGLTRVGRAVLCAGLSLSLTLAPSVAQACTQVYVGSGLTTNGDTFWGRAEDFANRYPKAFGVEPAYKDGKLIQSYENDVDPSASFSYRIDGPTFRYTYVRDTPDNWTDEGDPSAKAYSEAGTNEKGVSVSSTLTTSMNDKVAEADPLVDTGIGEYSIADFVLSQASSAREGVELLGKVIDEKGSQDCNQIVIGDASETWIFSQLSGTQWIAIKMAANQASLNPNMDDLKFSADLGDSSSCLHSEKIADVAKKAGTYAEDGGQMDVVASYGSSSEDQGAGQNTRYVQGHLFFGESLAEGTDYQVDEKGAVVSIANPSFYVTPAQKVDTFMALRSLGARGEGTPVDANKNGELYSIGNNRNTESHVFQVRGGLDADIATIQWEGLSRSEFTLFVPSYSALLTEVDERIYPKEDAFDISHVGESAEYSKNEAGEKVYDPAKSKANEEMALKDSGVSYLDYALMDLNTLAYNHRDSVAEGVHAYLDALQKEVIAQHEQVDAKMQATTAGTARNALANEAHKTVSSQTYDKVNALLGEVRAYIAAGDSSTPFAASDLAAGGGLVAPLEYASAMAAFDAEKAAADVKEPVGVELERSATTGQAAPVEAGLSVGNILLFVFFALFAGLIFVCSKLPGGKPE